MLGMNADTTLYGCLSERGLYSGYISVSSMKNTPVYIVSSTRPAESFYGRVIAMLQVKNENRLIVAPQGQIFYQSKLAEVLQQSGRFPDGAHLSCLYEKSCGAVVFHRGRDGIRLLLVRNCNGKYWSFPKGHMEVGENEHQTALREVYEETGLQVKIYRGFRQVSDYSPFGNIQKRVVFFLAETESDHVKIQRSEIESYIWVSFEQAKHMCSYQNDLRIIESAQRAIQAHDRH
ncbi:MULTISPECIES: bis(5'-nucleosyl)-tetraphosphatase [unclassified Ruminococcus]|uniref:bis(5'-nucleosyl)-tetraphosphatase n=1 Tax=unclassified Ruminococcus TaxID=2608920 RepID=UPI00210BAE6F|nr:MULTISPECIES: NUDIX domain-containing protein [unclassified Ruminococcus]MCQ4022017.1 NUDIX domain-containing protein [Ruminococcus sp. zg-924]MCQ4114553.1 NUDIX domain-containing protein [Ruminococcus sp. zg-921]